jgi:hypothetical protein
MIIRKPTKHVSVVKKALTIFGFPYFKDVQMFYPPSNKVPSDYYYHIFFYYSTINLK